MYVRHQWISTVLRSQLPHSMIESDSERESKYVNSTYGTYFWMLRWHSCPQRLSTKMRFLIYNTGTCSSFVMCCVYLDQHQWCKVDTTCNTRLSVQSLTTWNFLLYITCSRKSAHHSTQVLLNTMQGQWNWYKCPFQLFWEQAHNLAGKINQR